MSLDNAREKINALDGEIVRLLDERGRVCREIGAIKRGQGLPLYQPGREDEVLRRIGALSDGGMPVRSLEKIYRTVMAETIALQQGESACPGHAQGNKVDVPAKVTENIAIAPGFYRMRLHCPAAGLAFAPGQFFQIRIGLKGEGGFLRRPFAPSECGEDGFTFVYAVVGRGTRYMSELAPGAQVGVLAPLGNAYTIPAGMKKALLVGGGCGSPSLAPLARKLRSEGVNVTTLVGARTAEVLLEHTLFAKVSDRLIIATDDGSHGCRGTVVDAYRIEGGELRETDRIYSCGPTPMLRAVAAMAAEAGVPCEVSLEERMACGFGACVGCVVPVLAAGGGSVFRRVCHDGPVFDAAQLAWNEIK